MSTGRELTRTRILEAAWRLLVERGYQGVSLGDIGQQAGVSRQAIYLHFGSKPDLLVALVRYVDAQVGVEAIIRSVREAATALEALDRAVEAYATIEPQIYGIARVLHAARLSDPAAEAAWQDRMGFRRGGAQQLVLWLEREGGLAEGWTVEDAADFLWALLSVHTYEYLVVERGWPRPRFVRYLREVLRRAIVREPSEPPG